MFDWDLIRLWLVMLRFGESKSIQTCVWNKNFRNSNNLNLAIKALQRDKLR